MQQSLSVQSHFKASHKHQIFMFCNRAKMFPRLYHFLSLPFLLPSFGSVFPTSTQIDCAFKTISPRSCNTGFSKNGILSSLVSNTRYQCLSFSSFRQRKCRRCRIKIVCYIHIFCVSLICGIGPIVHHSQCHSPLGRF